MIPRSIIIIILAMLMNDLAAQDFITRGRLEFEVKRDLKKMFAEHRSESNEDYIASMPEFDISYKELTFSFGSSIYKAGKSSSGIFPSNNEIYTNLEKKQIVIKQEINGETYLYGDSLRNIRWRITNETRNIIGFNCRKAIGRIFDSVYVVAFYAPEIIPQAGPELFTGLPGMILGLAIPREHTTWFATKIEVANVDESVIKPPTMKKAKQYTKAELAEILFKKFSGVFGKDFTLNKVRDIMLGDFTL